MNLTTSFEIYNKLKVIDGGQGSGNFGHTGRPVFKLIPRIPQGHFLRSPSRLPTVCTLCSRWSGDENSCNTICLKMFSGISFLNSFPEYHKGTSYGRQVGSLRSALCTPVGRGTKTDIFFPNLVHFLQIWFLNSFPEYHKGTSFGRQVGSLRSALCAPVGRGDENLFEILLV